MRITSKGQVTIPIEIRDKMGLLPDTEVEFKITGNSVFLKKVGFPSKRGHNLISQMRRKER
jgi:AbrB family looped-hinge helix DNA binding protein